MAASTSGWLGPQSAPYADRETRIIARTLTVMRYNEPVPAAGAIDIPWVLATHAQGVLMGAQI